MSANVRLIPPVGYLEMLGLTASSRLVLTDSGGLQKEAYALEVPCVTMREETEWIETVEAGWNQLTGADCQRILSAVQKVLSSEIPSHPEYYGNGHASDEIVRILSVAR